MAKIKAEIIAKGTVQKVGYRDHVQETARNLNVKGYVENLRDGFVRIVCEADEDTLKKFIKLINIKQDLITVENIETVKTQPARGEYEYFDIKYGSLEEEMGERMVAAFKIATATRQEIKGMHKGMKNMHVDLKGSIQSMNEDMKNMHQGLNGSIQSMHKDLKESTESMHHDLKGSIQSMHKDLKESTESMHQDLKGSIQSMHKDVTGSIQSMDQDLKGSIESMHHDMNQNFKEMSGRYDAISAELLRTRKELKRSVDNLVKVIQKFLEKPA